MEIFAGMFIPHPVESKLELGNTRRVHIIDATNVKPLAPRLRRENSIPKQELVGFEPVPYFPILADQIGGRRSVPGYANTGHRSFVRADSKVDNSFATLPDGSIHSRQFRWPDNDEV